MRALGRVIAVTVMLTALSGCVVVCGNRGTLKGFHHDKQVIAIDGQIYVVDTTACTARTVSPATEDESSDASTTSTSAVEVTTTNK